MTHAAELNDEQLTRYARQVILQEVGEEGQLRLLRARVLVVGAGGLGAPLLLYLAGAGVGTLGVVDHDLVEIGNLHRQILHGVDDVGAPKTLSAAEKIAALNPGVDFRAHRARLTAENAEALCGAYDLVIDGSDNFTTRYLVNDACFRAGTPLVSGALSGFEGQVAVFRPAEGGPCYRCLFPAPPRPDVVSRCDTVGVLGPVAGLVGCLQATEALKELLGLESRLRNTLLLYDARDQRLERITLRRNRDCPACGGR